MDTQDTLINFGGQLKSLGGDRVGGYLVLFTDAKSPDLAGDFFTKETDFDIEDGQKTTILYDHCLDPTVKGEKLGKGTLRVDDEGVWFEGQLDRRKKYVGKILELAEQGLLGLSSGTAPHRVRRKSVGKASWIAEWPLGLDASLTPSPCEFRTKALALKSYAEDSDRKDFDSFFEGEESTPQPTFTQTSETVATAVEEALTKVGEAAESLKGFVPRVRNRLEFRELKDGRTISKPNRERLASMRGSIPGLKETLTAMESALDELLTLAEPKAKESSAFEMNPLEQGKSVSDIDALALAACAEFEALRFDLTVDPSRS